MLRPPKLSLESRLVLKTFSILFDWQMLLIVLLPGRILQNSGDAWCVGPGGDRGWRAPSQGRGGGRAVERTVGAGTQSGRETENGNHGELQKSGGFWDERGSGSRIVAGRLDQTTAGRPHPQLEDRPGDREPARSSPLRKDRGRKEFAFQKMSLSFSNPKPNPSESVPVETVPVDKHASGKPVRVLGDTDWGDLGARCQPGAALVWGWGRGDPRSFALP